VVIQPLLRIFAALLLLCSPLARAQPIEFHWVDPGRRWRTLDTAHFSVHFAEHNRSQAGLAAAVAERVYPRITGMLAWQPRSRTHVVVLDSADFSNGLASPLPFNYSWIFLSPPDEGELLQNRDWLELVLTHELFHIVHLDKARGFPLAVRNVLGRWPWSFPNALQPHWIIEGLAVYAESDAASGYGRLEHSHFEGMMRAERDRGLRSLGEVNAEGRGFPLNRDYLYGSYFFAFLRERYGQQAIIDFIESYSGKFFWLPVNSNPVRATGKPMHALWVEYHDWLRTRFAPKPVAPAGEGEILVRAFALFSPVLAPGGVRWYVQADGYTRPKLMRQAGSAAPEAVREVEQDTRLTAAAGDSVLASELDICRNHNLFYDLYEVAADGKRKRLTYCGRNRFAAPLDDGRIAALRVSAGEAEVVVLDPRGAVERALYRAAQGESLSGLAARAGTVVVTSLHEGRWSLLDITDGKVSVLLSDAAIKHSPRFGDSPDELFFIADYGKVYNVWSLRPASGTLSRWTQAVNGVKEVSAPVGGEMLLTTIEADGDALRLYRLPDAPLEQRAAPAQEAPPALRAETAAAGADRPYSPWSSLRPHAWLPLADFADGAFALGAITYGQDALDLHEYFVAPMYEVTQHQLLGSAAYLYEGRHSLLVNRTLTVKASDANNGNRKITAYSIKENAQWVSTWRHLALNQRFYWGLGAALEQEKLHQVDDGTSPVQNERVLGLVAGVDTRRAQWLSEGPSQGQWLRLFAETSSRLNATYTGNVYRADWRGHLALGKSVLALRWNEAYGQPGAEPFQLGGSRSDDWIPLPVLNQREFALRGYTSGEAVLTGHRARVLTTEWRTPLADVDRHSMAPPLGLNRVSLNLFLDVGAAWERGGEPDYHRGVGVELITEPRAAYVLGWQMRAGVAKGLDAPGTTKFYLRLGRSF
jgi:hypothetical protein